MAILNKKILFEERIENANSRILASVIKYKGQRKPICSILKFTGNYECETIYSGNNRAEFDSIFIELKELEIFDFE